jgi:hypothetical protein
MSVRSEFSQRARNPLPEEEMPKLIRGDLLSTDWVHLASWGLLAYVLRMI